MVSDNFYNVFDPKVLEESYKVFHAFTFRCAEFASQVAQEEGGKVEVIASTKIVFDTFSAAYDDIARYKWYHLDNPKEQKSDAVKRAAYFTKWIMRFRPLLVVDREGPNDRGREYEPLMFVNEHLAVQWGLRLIAQDNGLRLLILKKKVYNDIMYQLHFREISGDGWISIYQLIDDIAESRKENPIIEFPVS